MAATTVLNQKGRSHPAETLRVCGKLMNDNDPSVQKAVGWAIREVCKHDEPAAYAFLLKAKDKSHPRVLREASEKLTAAHRAAIIGKKWAGQFLLQGHQPPGESDRRARR